MYCCNCRSEIGDAQVCPACGTNQNPSAAPKDAAAEKEAPKSVASLVWGILGVVTAFFPIVGFIVAVFALITSGSAVGAKKSLGVPGLILSIFGLILTVLITVSKGAGGMFF